MQGWGLSCAVNVKDCDAMSIRSKEKIQDYVIQLCKLIDMKRYGDCQIIHFGTGNKEGFSMIQFIETSSITAHFSNDNNAAYIDVFSCKEFDPALVASFTQEFFAGSSSSFTYSLRD